MRGDGGQRDGLVLPDDTVEPVADLAHPDRLGHRQGGVERQRPQGLHLLDRAAGKHRGKAQRDTLAQHIALRVKHHPFDVKPLQCPGLLVVLKARQQPSRSPLDRQGPHQPLWIGYLEPFRRQRVFPLQQGQPLGGVERLNLQLNLSGNLGRHLGDIGESVQQGIEVKPCAANKNQRRIAGLGDDVIHCSQPLPGGKPACRRDRAVEAMVGLRHLIGARPRRHYPQGVIDLHGIGIDDHTALPLGHGERQRRLAAGSRTRYQDGTPAACHPYPP